MRLLARHVRERGPAVARGVWPGWQQRNAGRSALQSL